MTRTEFFKYFDLLADQPDAVAKMRELVLQLAVRGQLVEYIASEQKDDAWQKFRKSVNGDCNDDDLPPFDIPKHWHWVRLSSVADYSAARKVEPSEISEMDWVLDLEEIEKDTGRLLRFTSFKEKQSSSNKAEFFLGDVLYGKLRPYLNKVLVAPKAGFCTTEIVPIRSRGIIVPAYLCLFLRSPHFVAYTNAKSYGMKMPRLGTEDAVRAWIAIPSPDEQRRIVAKVDELMALCDELDARQQAQHDACIRLTQSAFHHLTTAKDSADFRHRFDFVIRHSSLVLDDVPQLRQTILQLAVQGRLVPQNPQDESAETFLKRIDTERAKRVAAKKLEASPRMKESVLPTNGLPSGWNWVHFGRISFCRDGERIPVNSDEREGLTKTYDYYGASGVIDKIDRYLFDEPLLLIGEDGANLVNRSTPIAFIAEGKYWVNNHAHVLDAIDRTLLEYLRVYINSINLEPYLTGMAQPKMNQAKMNSIPVPLPPLAEQKRIVARVEELMHLCDALEVQLQQTRTLGTQLLDSTLHHLLAGSQNETGSQSLPAAQSRPAAIQTEDYFAQLIPALLRTSGGTMSLEQLNAGVALLFLPKILNSLLQNSDNTEAITHFSHFNQPLKEATFATMLRLLSENKIISSDPYTATLRLNENEAPPIAPIVAEDARHLVAILNLVPNEPVQPIIRKLCPKELRETLMPVS